MSIFWLDREGKSPPPKANFFYRPFEGAQTTPLHTQLLPELPSLFTYQAPQSLSMYPKKEEWLQRVEDALEAISRKELSKVVLARKVVLEYEKPLDPFALCAGLKEKSQGAFLFCLRTQEVCLLGATPERLFKRKGQMLWTEALAGTKKKGEALSLLSSDKDRKEFSWIPLHFQERLQPLAQAPLELSSLCVHSTSHLHHLYQGVQATLNPQVTEEQILNQIHPTPALAGFPQRKALEWIQQVEQTPRFLYGAALGWQTLEESEYVVTIRSCLVQKNRAILYTGAGIVEGSDPLLEWEELDQKLQLFRGILF